MASGGGSRGPVGQPCRRLEAERRREAERRAAQEEAWRPEHLIREIRLLQAMLTTQEERAAMGPGPWEPPPLPDLDLELQLQILQAKRDLLAGRRPKSPSIPRL